MKPAYSLSTARWYRRRLKARLLPGSPANPPFQPENILLEGSMHFLSDEEMRELVGAEEAAFASPVPTQVVSSDEYLPPPQTPEQKEVEARLVGMSDRLAPKQGLSRRSFFQTAAGMAASFVAMNEVYGALFDATPLEAA